MPAAREPADVPDPEDLEEEPAAGVAGYGPDLPTEAELRLLGRLKGKRVLELGWGTAGSCVAFAREGATTIAVDVSAEHLARVRRRCEREEVRVELRHGDLAELAFLRADSIDLVFSAYGLGPVEDLGRVLRQAHRVLRPRGTLVFSLAHPAADLLGDEGQEGDRALLTRPYWSSGRVERPGAAAAWRHRTLSELYLALVRAGYRVEQLLEPEPMPESRYSPSWREAYRLVPPTLIVKARKEGV